MYLLFSWFHRNYVLGSFIISSFSRNLQILLIRPFYKETHNYGQLPLEFLSLFNCFFSAIIALKTDSRMRSLLKPRGKNVFVIDNVFIAVAMFFWLSYVPIAMISVWKAFKNRKVFVERDLGSSSTTPR